MWSLSNVSNKYLKIPEIRILTNSLLQETWSYHAWRGSINIVMLKLLNCMTASLKSRSKVKLKSSVTITSARNGKTPSYE